MDTADGAAGVRTGETDACAPPASAHHRSRRAGPAEGVFEEPPVETKATAPDEDSALVAALTQIGHQKQRNDYSPLEAGPDVRQ